MNTYIPALPLRQQARNRQDEGHRLIKNIFYCSMDKTEVQTATQFVFYDYYAPQNISLIIIKRYKQLWNFVIPRVRVSQKLIYENLLE